MVYGFLYLYSYMNNIGFLRYMFSRKNINKLLTIELIFIIFTSIIVFTIQPTNWIIGLIMLGHLFGVVWLVAFPDSFYDMYDEATSIDPGSIESMSGWMLVAFGVITYLSRLII